MSMESLKATFFAECEDLLDALTEGLSAISDGTADSETVHAIFRAVHSIKGSAGAFSLDTLVDFTHTYESVLDLIRSDALDVVPSVMKTIIRASDMLAILVENAQNDERENPETMQGILDELEQLLNPEAAEEKEKHDEPFVFEPIAMEALPSVQDTIHAEYEIEFSPKDRLYENSHDPALLFIALSELGAVTTTCNSASLPDIDSLDATQSHLSWHLKVTGDVTESEINAVFEFASGLCELEIRKAEVAELPKLEESPVETVPNTPKQKPAATTAPPPKSKTPTLRVDPERVDRLINTVGELIINQAVITQKVVASGIAQNSELMADLDDYGFLARDIQEAVMAIRAQPVKPLFQRMARIAREAGDATEKDVEFTMIGEMTEVDKSLVERLAEPLTHLVRNAVDHGLEADADRASSGKDKKGHIRLSAEHRSGHVMIEVSDDGRGLNREKILKRATEKGLISEDAKLSETEIDNLLFAPGFSTAQTVTNLSGRGVGLDVVKTSIQSMGGRVSISSTKGVGSKFSIALPLTLAVLDGMVVRAGNQTLVIPLSSIVETIRPNLKDIHCIGAAKRTLSIRGDYVPVVSMSKMLGLQSDSDDSAPSVLVHIAAGGASPVAMAVDDISDQRQVVIKSLEPNYKDIPGVSAATILGDGKVALIIDPEAIAKMATQTNVTPSKTPIERQYEHATQTG